MSALAAEPLFPDPLHLVRKIDDPLAGTSITVHEYCAGNRIATVHGDRVAIVDYSQQRIVEIDRRAATYSVTRFEEIASAQPQTTSAANPREPLRETGAGTYAGRIGDDVRIEVAGDRRVELSRDAVEALIGAAYPNPRRAEHDAILEAARRPRERVATDSAPATYALPSSQTTIYQLDGRELTVRNAVLSIGHELAPPELLAIPPGARQVESSFNRAARELRALESKPR